MGAAFVPRSVIFSKLLEVGFSLLHESGDRFDIFGRARESAHGLIFEGDRRIESRLMGRSQSGLDGTEGRRGPLGDLSRFGEGLLEQLGVGYDSGHESEFERPIRVDPFRG